MRQFNTLTGFLLSKSTTVATGDIVELQGYDTEGDGGKAQWKQTGVTGQTPSQSPAQLGDALLNDANGNQWALVGEITTSSVGGGYFAGDKSYTIDTPSFVSTQTIALSFGIDNEESLTWADTFNSGLVTVTTPFFSNAGTPTHKRQSGRMFIGEAASKFAGDAGLGDGGTSWLSSGTNSPSYLAVNSHLLVTNDSGNYAATFGARSLNNSGAGVIAVGSAVKNDKAGGRGWGFIAELQHEQGASVTNGIEVAAKNKSTDDFTYSPYTASFGVFGARLAAGGDDLFGGLATNPSTAAIIIIKNAETWNTGIVFASDSLTGTDGSAASTTSANAITLARRHLIRWNSPEGANTFGAGIVSTVTETTKSTTQQFIDNGINFVNSAGYQISRINGGASTVNFLQMDASLTGAPVKLSAQGGDTNINLRLDAKGTGKIQFGTHVAQGDLPTNGYITILDSSGNSRRIATV